MTKEDIIKKKSVKSMTISILIIIAGVAVSLLDFEYSKLLGALLIICGLIALIFTKKDSIYKPTGSKVLSYVYFYNPIEKQKIKTILENKNFEDLKAIQSTEHGIQMELFMSKDHEFAAAQLYDYVPHRYVEASPLYEYTGDDAQRLSTII